jgi:hypothetical protein
MCSVINTTQTSKRGELDMQYKTININNNYLITYNFKHSTKYKNNKQYKCGD